jgi:hypothetical protein
MSIGRDEYYVTYKDESMISNNSPIVVAIVQDLQNGSYNLQATVCHVSVSSTHSIVWSRYHQHYVAIFVWSRMFGTSHENRLEYR